MNRRKLVFFAFLAIAFFVAAPLAEASGDIVIGGKIDGFSLPDTNGKTRTFDELKGKNGAVVIFLSAQCPVVRGYNARINQIAADYEAKGINFIGVNSNASEGLDWVKSNAAENYKFPVLIDKGNVLADKLGANVTPEAFYFDAANSLVYHGAIDNDRSGKNIRTSYLRAAFDASLGGKKVDTAEANAFGCSIKRIGDN
ncbi:MAG TPA: redoxin domain-containing protein [Pyrinomonadaceae bacterium]|nr:redoxin domain-containing protein [Pyrinomonadaceae bacterium]